MWSFTRVRAKSRPSAAQVGFSTTVDNAASWKELE